MNKNIKKVIAMILVFALMISMLPIKNIQAETIYVDEKTGLKYEEVVSGYDADPNFKWEKEILVYAEDEDDLFTLDHNPNYRYIYQLASPLMTRAACYSCGKETMKRMSVRSQWGSDDKQCPLQGAAGLYNDLYNTWTTMLYDKCDACGYVSGKWEESSSSRSYTSYCSNDDNPGSGGEWRVYSASSFILGQHNVHQYKPWWTDKQLPY